MDVSTQNEGAHHALTDSATRVHIADINHNDSASINDRFLEAEIVLVWPYSTLTQEAGFLLAEKDVLLRKTKGQVRTTFHGLCAREIARLKAGVGDTLRISLASAQLVEEQDEISTPGKKAGFAVKYQHAVDVEILREDGKITALNYEEPVVASPIRNGANGTLATPRETRLNATVDPELSMLSSTPNFKTGSRLSSNSFPGSFVDPFISEDGSVAGRGRKRTKFGRHSGAWRLVDNEEDEQEQPSELLSPPVPPSFRERTQTEAVVPIAESIIFVTEDAPTPQIPIESPSEAPVPQKAENIVTDAEVPEQSLGHTDKAETSPSSIHTSSLLSSPGQRIRIERPSFDSETMPTPRLQALASPGLSIVSPLVARSQYFPTFERTVSELDASSQKHDQTVFADSSPILNDSVEVDQLDQLAFPDPSRTGPITIDEALGISNSQAAFFPSSALRSDEIDLDALQEQIEINNATPSPIEVVEEVIEDTDMYGPSIGSPHANELGVVYPSLENLVELPLESMPVVLEERYIPIEQPLIEVEAGEVIIDATDTAPEVVMKPLPSLLDNAVRELEFFARDYEPVAAGDDVLPAEEEPEFSFFPRPKRTDNQTPHFLDGSVEIDLVESEDARDQPIDALQELQVEPEIVIADQPMSSEVTEQASTVTITENIIIKEDLPVTVSEEAAPLSPLREHIEVEIRPAEETHATDEPDVIVDQETAPEKLSQKPEAIPRRKSQRLTTRPGIYSEYFTPRKSSKARGSSPIPGEVGVLQDTAVHTFAGIPESTFEEEAAATSSQAKSLTSNLTTELGFYVHLSQLAEYYNQVVDVIAICPSDSTAPERAKSGPKDFHTSLQLVSASEDSIQDAQITAQIFRPRKNVLPHTRRGDVVVLRGFLVQSMAHKPMLLSADASAWAVFPSEDELRHDSKMPVIVSGPPIELGSGEEDLASNLFSWWKAEGAVQNPEPNTRTSLDHGTPSQPKSARQTRKSRSELPPPLDLRRSPRKVRQEQSQTSTGQDRSPSFQPLSPTYSQRSFQSSMAPPSIPSAISPPLYASTSQSGTGAMSKEYMSQSLNRETDETEPQDASISKTPTFTRRHTRSISRASVDASQAPPLNTLYVDTLATDSHPTVDTSNHQTSTPFRQNLSGSASEDNSVSGETNSSRRRRHERRSTSLIHELRDGTQWVDIEDSEIVSVSASEDEDGDQDQMLVDVDVEEEREPRNARDMEAEAEAHAQAEIEAGRENEEDTIDADMEEGEPIQIVEVEQPELPSTPVRRGRGRPRKDDTQISPPSTRSSRHARMVSQESVEGEMDTSPAGTAEVSAQRVTRSRGKAADKTDNVHELRDGAKYID